MSKLHKTTDRKILAMTVILTVMALYALYVGLSALYTGQFFEIVSRSGFSKVTVVTGAKAYCFGAFVASVGVTTLAFLLDGISTARLQFVCLLINAALFIAAVLSITFA